jgi:hypothetical protein
MHGNVLEKREFQALSILVADFDYLWICVQIDIFAYPQGKSLLSIYLVNDGSSNSGVEGSCFLVMIYLCIADQCMAKSYNAMMHCAWINCHTCNII